MYYEIFLVIPNADGNIVGVSEFEQVFAIIITLWVACYSKFMLPNFRRSWLDSNEDLVKQLHITSNL